MRERDIERERMRMPLSEFSDFSGLMDVEPWITGVISTTT